MPPVAIGIMAVGAAVSAYSSIRQAREARRANKRAERIESVRAQRARVQAIRQNRIQAAEVFAASANAGVAGSSPVQGAIGASQTATASNIQFAEAINQLNMQRMRAIANAQQWQSIGQGAQALGQAAGQINQAYQTLP